MLRVGEIARVELGAKNYVMGSSLNGRPAANIAIYQLPGANLIQISDQVAPSSSRRPGPASRTT